MSIAGVIAVDCNLGRFALENSLSRLALTEDSPRKIIRSEEALLGAVDNASLSSHMRGPAAVHVLAAFDGTLYERDQFIRELGLEQTATDSEIVARAYLCWGDTFPDRLYGEFALAIWDALRHRLLLARDPLARIPLYYATAGSDFCFGSEPRAFDGWPGVNNSLNQETLARILSMQPSSDMTLRKGIFSLRGAHVLIREGENTPRLLRYWEPTRIPLWHAPNPHDYAEALHEAMVRAVGVRLPSQGLVGSHLSSGFDSSGVTALAAQALARQNRPLVAYTSVPRHRTDAKAVSSNRFDDEWPLAAKVAAMYPNIEHVAIHTDSADWWEALDVMSSLGGGVSSFIRNARWYYAILKDAQSRGLTTMLEGQAGNLTSSYAGSFGLYDLRRRHRWMELVHAMRQRHRKGEKWRTLIYGMWMPSARTYARVQRLRGRKRPDFWEHSMMRRDFYESTGLPPLETSAIGSIIEGNRSSGSTWRLSILEGGDMGMMSAMQMRGFGIRRQDPTADRRLVELCLSIPDEAFCPNGVKRDLYREAFRNDLPSDLLNEQSRGLQSSDFLEMFGEWLPQWYEELNRLEACPAVSRYLDLPRMRKLLDDYSQMVVRDRGSADLAYNFTFGGAIALGRFLRKLEEQQIP